MPVPVVKLLVDCFLSINVSDEEKAKWWERIEGNRQGFDSQSFLKKWFNSDSLCDSGLNSMGMMLKNPTISEEEHALLLDAYFSDERNDLAKEIQRLCSEVARERESGQGYDTANYKKLMGMAIYINDYEKVFGDYYFEQVYAKNRPNAVEEFGKSIQEITTYDKLLKTIINEKIKVNEKQGKYTGKNKYQLQEAKRNDRNQEKGVLERSFDGNLEFMRSELGVKDLLEWSDLDNLTNNDSETALNILKVLIEIRKQQSNILSQLKKPALDKKECALGRGQSRIIGTHFDFIRRELMKNLTLAELESLTIIAACFDYNRTYLQEVLRDFISEISQALEKQYTSTFLSTDIAGPQEVMYEKLYHMSHVLFPCFRAECVKSLKKEIKKLIQELSGQQIEKRPYRHIAYLHSIGICGFSYSDEYDVYHKYFQKKAPKWNIKNWITDEQRKRIKNISHINWEFQWSDETLELLLPKEEVKLPLSYVEAVHSDITTFIKELHKKGSRGKVSNVLSLPKDVIQYLTNSVDMPDVLNNINERPDIYLLLNLLSNYIIHARPDKSFDASMLALCVLCRERFKQGLKLLEPKHRGEGSDRESKKVDELLWHYGTVSLKPTFYLTTIGFMMTQLIDEFYQGTNYAEEYMDWLEIKRDLSNLLVDRAIIQDQTPNDIIEERNRIFKLIKDRMIAKQTTILNHVRNKFIVNS